MSYSKRLKIIVLFIVVLFALSSATFLMPFSKKIFAVSALEDQLKTNDTVKEDEQAANQAKISDGLTITHSAQAAQVLETGRQKILYEYADEEILIVPTAAKLMTMFLACERLSLDTMVTISSEAAKQKDASASPDFVELNSGDKYLLEYLLLRLLYYNSDAAAVAIAEQIANEESKFVDLMNTKAETIGLEQTLFANSTGNPVYGQSGTNEQDPSMPLQYTSAADLAILLNAATQNQIFADLFSRSNEQIIIGGEKLVPMRSEIEPLWTLSEGAVKGAMLTRTAGTSTILTVGKINDISLITVLVNSADDDYYGDTLSLYSSIDNFYVMSPLVTAGEVFATNYESTIDGEIFGLVYSRTVFYVHPKNNDFLQNQIQYRSAGPHSRPIQRNMIVGQVIFELDDGSFIPVDVSPDRQILSTINIIDRALDQLQLNPNLTYVIFAALFTLVLVLLYNLYQVLKELIRLIILVMLEKKAHKS